MNDYMDFIIPIVDISNDDISLCCHKYLNKWGNTYHCMNCNYTLDDINDSDRIEFEKKLEENTIIKNSDEDDDEIIIGKKSQERGVSIKFLLAFTKYYNCWNWNSWDIVKKIIKPATEKERCRFIELDEMINNVGNAHTFISYAQAGNWGDLIAAILDGNADLNRFVWIDLFAVRQWPCKKPDLDFANTIQYCQSFLIVCSNVIDFKDNNNIITDEAKKKVAFLRVWCLVEISAAAKNELPIIIKCGRYNINNNNSIKFDANFDMLSILYDEIDINNASSTVKEDEIRIKKDIEEKGLGLNSLNKVIKGVLKSGMAFDSYNDMKHISSIIQCAACGDYNALQAIKDDASNNLRIAAMGGYSNVLEWLIQNGANVNNQCCIGTTPIMRAARVGHMKCIQILLNHNADINIKSNDDHTVLMSACILGREDVVDLLLKKGADVNAKKMTGDTALILAAASGSLKCVELLSKYDIKDINAVNNKKRSAIIEATIAGHDEVVSFLKKLNRKNLNFSSSDYEDDDDDDNIDNLEKKAKLFKDEGDYENAFTLFDDCLDKRRQLLGDNHQITLETMFNLAQVSELIGDYENAFTLFDDCLDKRRQIFGDNHPITLETIFNLAQVSEYLDNSTTESLYLKCLRGRRIVLGDNSVDTLMTMSKLAKFFQRQEKFILAEELFTECLMRRRDILGNDHPITIKTILNFADFYEEFGSFSEALPLYKEYLQIARVIYGDSHSYTVVGMKRLASIYESLEHYDDAKILYEESLKYIQLTLGETHPCFKDTITSISRLTSQP